MLLPRKGPQLKSLHLKKTMVLHPSCQAAWLPRFAVLKAFLLDKDMTDLEVETMYVEMAKEKTKVNWEELPLDELEKIYSTEEQRKWLKEKVVDRWKLKSIRTKVYTQQLSAVFVGSKFVV